MFSLDIVDTDAFLEMPTGSQLLYFHLSMRADDEGFVGNPRKIMKIVGCQEDEFKVLIAKRFLINFENGVVVIKHWLIHNIIRMDRFSPTKWQDEKNSLIVKENKAYSELATSRQPVGNQVLPQVKISKDKLSKDIIIAADAAKNEIVAPKSSLKDLYNSMGLPKAPVRTVNLWQDEANNCLLYFTDGEGKRSSVFKCFKNNQQKARIAFSDCKELEKHSVLYFLKVFNELTKK